MGESIIDYVMKGIIGLGWLLLIVVMMYCLFTSFIIDKECKALGYDTYNMDTLWTLGNVKIEQGYIGCCKYVYEEHERLKNCEAVKERVE